MTGPARRALLLLPLAVPACVIRRPADPAPQPRYHVGVPYETGGVRYYPREDMRYEATGLAVAAPARDGLTANGEAADGSALTAAHRTLQLPAVARVTALGTGRQILVRVNDRGPAEASRLIAVSPRAAELLGLASGEPARVRVQVEQADSERLRDELGGGPRLQIAAAPRDAVGRETLPPPPGVAASSRAPAPELRAAASEPAAPGPSVPLRLPETVRQVAPAPGQLWVRAGAFGRADYAARQRAQLAGLPTRIDLTREGRTETFRVRAGPFATVAEADSALDQARRAGVTDARITVE